MPRVRTNTILVLLILTFLMAGCLGGDQSAPGAGDNGSELAPPADRNQSQNGGQKDADVVNESQKGVDSQDNEIYNSDQENTSHNESDSATDPSDYNSYSTTVAFSDSNLALRGEGKVGLKIGELTAGLSGYILTIKITNGSVASFTCECREELGVAFLAPTGAAKVDSCQNSQITFRAVDFAENIQEGAEDVKLAEVCLKGQKEGKTNIDVIVDRLEGDKGYLYTTTTDDGSVRVEARSTATRMFLTESEQPEVTPGGQINVSVTVTVPEGLNYNGLAVDEQLPAGWEVVKQSAGKATFKESTTDWLWLESSGPTELTINYTIQAPDSIDESQVTFSGRIKSESPELDAAISGDTKLEIDK